jgi:hypothetical protein
MAIRRLGCMGSLVFCVVIVLAMAALTAPWSFHVGGRWTPTTAWYGVGMLRDSSGQQYGIFLSFFPNLGRRGRGVITGPAMPTPQTSLRGKALVCTQQGLRIPFNLRGDVYGAWLSAEGKLIRLNLSEPAKQKPRRHFDLSGSFSGPELAMDDQKSIFMYLRPDGKLTPTRSYTSPVPEKHATVTLQWGSEADFDRLCGELRNSSPGS